MNMNKKLGVESVMNKKLGVDFTIDSLKADGFNAIFLAFGHPEEIKPDFPCKGANTSKEFLEGLCGSLKLHNGQPLPDFNGKKVIVLGGQVTMAFRKDFSGMNAHPSEIEALIVQGIELMPLVAPTSIENGTVVFRLQQKDMKGQYSAA